MKSNSNIIDLTADETNAVSGGMFGMDISIEYTSGGCKYMQTYHDDGTYFESYSCGVGSEESWSIGSFT